MRVGALKMRVGGQSDFIMRVGGSARGCSPDPDFITAYTAHRWELEILFPVRSDSTPRSVGPFTYYRGKEGDRSFMAIL